MIKVINCKNDAEFKPIMAVCKCCKSSLPTAQELDVWEEVLEYRGLSETYIVPGYVCRVSGKRWQSEQNFWDEHDARREAKQRINERLERAKQRMLTGFHV